MNKSDFKTLYFDEGASGSNSEPAPDNKSNGTPAGVDNSKGNDNSGQNKTEGNKADDKTYNAEEVNNMIDKAVNRAIAKERKRSEAAAEEAAKLAKMSEQEKLEHERDKLQAELDELKRANAIAEMTKIARGMLQDNGVTVSDKVVECFIREDAEATKAVIKDFIKGYRADIQAGVKAALGGKAPVGGSVGAGMTKEEISKIPDRVKRQEAIRQNMGLYNTKR